MSRFCRTPRRRRLRQRCHEMPEGAAQRRRHDPRRRHHIRHAALFSPLLDARRAMLRPAMMRDAAAWSVKRARRERKKKWRRVKRRGRWISPLRVQSETGNRRAAARYVIRYPRSAVYQAIPSSTVGRRHYVC